MEEITEEITWSSSIDKSLTVCSAPVDVGEAVADDAEVAETSSSPQSNGKCVCLSQTGTGQLSWMRVWP